MMLTRQVKYFILRFIRHDSKKVKIFVVLVLLSSISFYSWLFHTLFRDRMKEDRFLGLHKCPACYGTSLCPAIKSGKLKLRGWSAVSALDLVNVKNVHTGMFEGQHVIVKKLGRNRELRELDETLCAKAGTRSEQGASCDVTAAIRAHPLVTSAEVTVSLVTGLSDMLACPSRRLLDLIMEKFSTGDDSDRREPAAGHVTRMHLATVLSVNPEPVVMQVGPRFASTYFYFH